MDNLFERTVTSKEIYKGNIFSIKCDEVELPGGRYTIREVVAHLNGVAVVAEINGKILMVKQYRYPTRDVLYEIPAGKLDKENENELEAAKRELEEETGYIAENWEELGYIWTSPGFCNERIFLFKASNLTYKNQNLDEDEFLDCVSVEKSKVFDMIKLGIINDAKSIAGIMRAYSL